MPIPRLTDSGDPVVEDTGAEVAAREEAEAILRVTSGDETKKLLAAAGASSLGPASQNSDNYVSKLQQELKHLQQYLIPMARENMEEAMSSHTVMAYDTLTARSQNLVNQLEKLRAKNRDTQEVIDAVNKKVVQILTKDATSAVVEMMKSLASSGVDKDLLNQIVEQVGLKLERAQDDAKIRSGRVIRDLFR